MRRAAMPLLAFGFLAGCSGRAPCPGPACGAACPRDATVDTSGRCACIAGEVPVLGACVPPAVADAYCMAPAHADARGGCEPPPCAADEAVDVETGCVPLSSVLHAGRACDHGDRPSALLVDDRRSVCVPADAACPRGTRAVGGACASPPTCPPGSLRAPGSPESCRAFVSWGPNGVPVVDVGTWAATVLGPDRGGGSDELCRPLAARPELFGLGPGDTLPLRVHVRLTFPAQDVSAVRAWTDVREVAGPVGPARQASLANPDAGRPGRPGTPATPATPLEPPPRPVQEAVDSLVEPLRSLGGQASAASVELAVTCTVQSR